MATDEQKAACQKRKKRRAKIKQTKPKIEPRQRRRRLLIKGQRGGRRK